MADSEKAAKTIPSGALRPVPTTTRTQSKGKGIFDFGFSIFD
jgi:hypothetical protein